MTCAIELTGQRFGRLVVQSKQGTKGNHLRWLCRCDCGNQKEVASQSLRLGLTKSCGCLASEIKSAVHTTHGQSSTKLHGVWRAMRKRCSNPSATNWGDYGGRGIKVCDRWQKFENFYADMGDPPPGTSLDRIDVNGDYEPSNCRWATRNVQQRNTRVNRLVTYREEAKTLIEWAEELHMNYDTLRGRLNRNWSVIRAFETPMPGSASGSR